MKKYVCNDLGIFLNPDVIDIVKDKTCHCSIRIAKDENGFWHCGFDYCNKTHGSSSPVSKKWDRHLTEISAKVMALENLKRLFEVDKDNKNLKVINNLLNKYKQLSLF